MKQLACRRFFAFALAAGALGIVVGGALAQDYPAQPIRILVGFAAGGPADALTRIAAQVLSEGLHVPVVVDNRAGAGGAIAANTVAGATPDGYTLLSNAVSDIVNPLTNRQIQYNIETSFAPVGLIASAPNVLVVHPSLPVASVQELVEYARSHPNALNYGSAGIGTVSHIAGAYVGSAAHVQFVHIPYKGTAAAQLDLISGRLQFMFDGIASGLANAKAGKVRVLAVTSPKRWPSAPLLPTMAESGFPGFNMTAWWGLLAPAGTPSPIVARLADVLSKGMQSAEARERVAALGGEPGRMTVTGFAEYIHTENARWKRIFDDGLVHIDD